MSLNQIGNTLTAGGNINLSVGSCSHDGPSERQKVADWLFDIAMVNHYAIQNETFAKVTPGTASWILETPELETWITRPSGTFWGVGIPGAGKTILSSFMVHHLEARSDPKTKGIVLFAYARFNDDLTVSKILATLLGQLVDNSLDAFSYIGESLYRPCVAKKIAPTEAMLAKSLREGIDKASSKVYVVVDALDELKDDVREALVGLLLSLNRLVFLTSRELSLPGLASPDLRIRAPTHDFCTFITAEIKRLPKLSSLLMNRADVLEEVVKKITSKSEGMFLLAALQIAALGHVTSVKNLKKALEKLPTKLADMYEMTLERIMDQDEEESSLACHAILWVTHAFQPFPSSKLLAALAIDLDSTELDPDALTNEKTLTSVCCGLLTIEHNTKNVRLIHYTTYNFFSTQNAGLWRQPHTYIARICALYLQLANVNSHSVLEYQDLRDRAITHPLAEYAATNLGQHITHATREWNGVVPSTASHLVSPNASIPLSVIWFSSYFDYGNIVHSIATRRYYFGVPDNLVYDPKCLTQLSHSGYTPLHYVCIHGLTPVLEWMLKQAGVDVNQPDATGKTALSLAARRKRKDEMVRMLLQSPGIDIHSRDNNGATALHLACYYHCRSAAELLLDAPGIDVNAEDIEGNTPLHYACLNRSKSLINLMVHCDRVRINARSRAGFTPLHYACMEEHMEGIQELLRHPDISVDIRDKDGNTELALARLNGRDRVVQLLQDYISQKTDS